MNTKRHKIKAFVTEWSDDLVSYYCFEIKETRISNMYLFDNMKLFKGKNVWLDVNIVPGTMDIKNNESKQNRLIQLWNYYIRGKF